MTGSSDEELSELSDKEIQEVAEEIAGEFPEAMGVALGVDVFAGVGEERQEEVEENIRSNLESFLTDFRDAYSRDSEEERIAGMSGVFTGVVEQFAEDPESVDNGFEFLVDRLRLVLEGSRESMEELGYVEYFDVMDDFAEEVVEDGEIDEVEEFYEHLGESSQQVVLQRIMDPVFTDYFAYLEEHPEITEASEVRQYADMYYELAELVSSLLPQFMAVVQIAEGREQTFEKLNRMGLNNLVQKLEGKKYSRFNSLAEGIDRELRNSIGHRDFITDPVNQELVFRDRGDNVAELTYKEFKNEVFHLLALLNALWIFRLQLQYYHLQKAAHIIEEIEQT